MRTEMPQGINGCPETLKVPQENTGNPLKVWAQATTFEKDSNSSGNKSKN
jgi:hypothetical protein